MKFLTSKHKSINTRNTCGKEFNESYNEHDSYDIKKSMTHGHEKENKEDKTSIMKMTR